MSGEPMYSWCGLVNPHGYHLIGPLQLFDAEMIRWCPGSTLPGLPVEPLPPNGNFSASSLPLGDVGSTEGRSE